MQTEAEGHWRQQQRLLQPAMESLSPCISHPGDCKHWLAAMASYRTSLYFPHIHLCVLMDTEARQVSPACAEGERELLFKFKRGGKEPLLTLEFENIEICLFGGTSCNIAAVLRQTFSTHWNV